MRFCLDKSILGADQHYFDGWTKNVPENTWIVGKNISSEWDLLSALHLCGNHQEILPSKAFVKMMRSLTFKEVPWKQVLPEHEFDLFLSETIGKINKALDETDLSYYREVFVPAYKALAKLSPAKIHNKKWEFLATHNIHGANEDVIDSFEPNEDGFADRIVYEQIKTISGRHIVKRGPQILRLNRDFKTIIKSRYDGGKIIQFDFVSLEPRIALMLAGKEIKDDIYSDINETLFEGRFTREIAKLVTLSVLYGSGIKKLSEETGLDLEKCKEMQPMVQEYFDVFRIRRRLIEEYKKNGFIRNFFGRAIYPKDASGHKLYNNYIQSTAVDAAMLGFWNIFQMLPELIIPIFIIHDNAMLDFPPELISDELINKIKRDGGNIMKLPGKLLLGSDML